MPEHRLDVQVTVRDEGADGELPAVFELSLAAGAWRSSSTTPPIAACGTSRR